MPPQRSFTVQRICKPSPQHAKINSCRGSGIYVVYTDTLPKNREKPRIFRKENNDLTEKNHSTHYVGKCTPKRQFLSVHLLLQSNNVLMLVVLLAVGLKNCYLSGNQGTKKPVRTLCRQARGGIITSTANKYYHRKDYHNHEKENYVYSKQVYHG